MSMEDLIQQMLGGSDAQKRKQQTGGNPLGDLLGGILGGVAPQQGSGTAPQQGASAGGLGDILGDILGGMTPQQSSGKTPQQGATAGGLGDILGGILGGADGKLDAGDLAGILGGILGGGGAAQQGSRGGVGSQSGAGGLGDILGGILGGGASQQGSQGATGAGGLGDILHAILGGSSGANIGANSFLAPIAMALAEKLGLSPAMAQAVVAFVLTKLLPGLSGAARSQAAPSATPRRSSQQQTQKPEGLDLDYLLDTMGKGEAPDASYLRRSGMAEELAQQTGMDPNTAIESLQHAIGLLGGQLSAGRSKPQASEPRKGGLDGLLDTWDR